jgi:hypothetical protein
VWLIDGILDWMIGFIAPYTFTRLGSTGNYSAIADLRTIQFTVTHALGFSIFISRILATDISVSLPLQIHVKYSYHSLIPFLKLLCSYQFRRLDSFQFQAHIPTGWRVEAQPFTFGSTALLLLLGRVFWVCPFITHRHGPHRKHSLYCCQGVFTVPLPSKNCPFIPRVCFCGNVFSESLPSNEYTRHNTNLNAGRLRKKQWEEYRRQKCVFWERSQRKRISKASDKKKTASVV